ncbi:MAG: hypothetical protein AAB793_01190, partial [Patescibacteria group bacterium]
PFVNCLNSKARHTAGKPACSKLEGSLLGTLDFTRINTNRIKQESSKDRQKIAPPLALSLSLSPHFTENRLVGIS